MNKTRGLLVSLGILAAPPASEIHATDSFDNTIEAFLDDYPLQLINDFMHQRTQGKTNDWFLAMRTVVQAGEDVVVSVLRILHL